MKDLIKLISIANKLDNKGLTKEADLIDGLITKMAQHDDWDEELEPTTEELDAIEKDEETPSDMSDDEIKVHLEDLRAMIDSGTLSESDKLKVVELIHSLKIGLSEPEEEFAWNAPGLTEDFKTLPIAEASKRRK